MGKPWFSKQVNHYLKTGELLPEPSIQERLELAIKHCELLVRYKGVHTGIQESRRHINNYISGLPGAGRLRAKIITINSFQEAQDAIREIMLEPVG
jgi:tRNA-dihydrouridine synthase